MQIFCCSVSKYRHGCAKRSHAGIVFTHWYKNRFFAPQGRHVAPINVKFGTVPLPRAKFYVYRGRNVRVQPSKLSKLRILAINLPLRGHSFAQFFYEILRFCTRR